MHMQTQFNFLCVFFRLRDPGESNKIIIRELYKVPFKTLQLKYPSLEKEVHPCLVY